jgi:hypothetical protein
MKKEGAKVLLVTKFNSLEQYLEKRLFFEDPDLQQMVTQLGLEVDETEQDYSDMKSRMEESQPWRGYGGSYI